jgi:hypothetical protein
MTRQIVPGTVADIKLAVPAVSAFDLSGQAQLLTMCHDCQVWEGHSPQCIEIDTSGMLEHSRAELLRCRLLVLGMMVQQHHGLFLSAWEI